MGYGISCVAAHFRLPATQQAAALQALQLAAQNATRHIPTTLRAAFEAIGYVIEMADAAAPDDITNLIFDGEKWNADHVPFLQTLAPFVAPASWLAFVGEDHAHWRWYFDGTSLREQIPSYTWRDVAPTETR